MKIQFLYKHSLSRVKPIPLKDIRNFGFTVWLPEFEIIFDCCEDQILTIGKVSKELISADGFEFESISSNHIYLMRQVFLTPKARSYFTEDIINLFSNLVDIINSEAVFGV